jgi:hypothetical protein
MPLNTRVGRCVTKLKKKYGYGPAIGICQRSTRQNYMTGKSMRRRTKKRIRKRGRRRRNRKKKTTKRYTRKKSVTFSRKLN